MDYGRKEKNSNEVQPLKTLAILTIQSTKPHGLDRG